MTTFVVEVREDERGPTDKTLVYFATVLPRLKSPGVVMAEGTSRRTQEETILYVESVLRRNVHDGDTIVFSDVNYPSIDDALAGMRATMADWA